MKTKDQQLCAFRELVMAQHALQRSIDEFSAATGVSITSQNIRELQSMLMEVPPRDVAFADMEELIGILS